MEPIVTTDNNLGHLGEQEQAKVVQHLADLQFLSSQPLAALHNEHSDLLIFPHDFKVYGDEIGNERMFSLDGTTLVTGNIMGYVGYNDTLVNIRSRFADDGGKDYFLHYMLQRVLSLNMFNLDVPSSREHVFNILLYMFPALLKAALRQGLYREYQARAYNDAHVRGRIDLARHLRHNIPFTGRVSYSTREYVADNHVTQLLRHTLEYISHHPLGRDIVSSDVEMREAASLIYAATPSYSRLSRQGVISHNLRPLSHPYYSAYLPLQRLCVRILRHEEMKYGRDDNRVHGILFDGSWLWEEYLNTILKGLGFVHPRNRTNKVGKKMFANPHSVLMQPDFYLEDSIVLDAKYKSHGSLFDGGHREDRFQLLSYMHVFNVKKSGLIVPLSSRSEGKTSGILAGRGGEMHLIEMEVNAATDNFSAYRSYMQEQERRLQSKIAQLIQS